MSNKYEIIINQEDEQTTKTIFSLTFNSKDLDLDFLIELINKIKNKK